MRSGFLILVNFVIMFGVLHLWILLGLVWQRRVFAWPVTDEEVLTKTDSDCRLQLYETNDGLKFKRQNPLRRALQCAKYLAIEVVPGQLPVLAVCTILSTSIAILLSQFSAWHAFIPSAGSAFISANFSAICNVVAIVAVIPVLVCWELILFKKLESRSALATLRSWRFVGCISYLTSLLTICTFGFYCLLNIHGAELSSLITLALSGLNISMLPFNFFVFFAANKYWLSKEKLNRTDRETLGQSVINTNTLANKSDYELHELSKCANNMGEFAIAQWMADELLKRSEKLELYDNYKTPDVQLTD